MNGDQQAQHNKRHHQPCGAKVQLGKRIGARNRNQNLEEEDKTADHDAVEQQAQHIHPRKGLHEILQEEGVLRNEGERRGEDLALALAGSRQHEHVGCQEHQRAEAEQAKT